LGACFIVRLLFGAPGSPGDNGQWAYIFSWCFIFVWEDIFLLFFDPLTSIAEGGGFKACHYGGEKFRLSFLMK